MQSQVWTVEEHWSYEAIPKYNLDVTKSLVNYILVWLMYWTRTWFSGYPNEEATVQDTVTCIRIGTPCVGHITSDLY